MLLTKMFFFYHSFSKCKISFVVCFLQADGKNVANRVYGETSMYLCSTRHTIHLETHGLVENVNKMIGDNHRFTISELMKN